MSKKPILYFLCTGNSCRSQMAEGFGKEYLGEYMDVYSAGIEAHGVNPKAIQAMKEVGIDISDQTSDQIQEEIFSQAKYIITLCGDAKENCPVVPPYATHLHWGFDDPAKAKGTEKEIWEVFQRVRDEIKEKVKSFLEQLEG